MKRLSYHVADGNEHRAAHYINSIKIDYWAPWSTSTFMFTFSSIAFLCTLGV